VEIPATVKLVTPTRPSMFKQKKKEKEKNSGCGEINNDGTDSRQKDRC